MGELPAVCDTITPQTTLDVLKETEDAPSIVMFTVALLYVLGLYVTALLFDEHASSAHVAAWAGMIASRSMIVPIEDSITKNDSDETVMKRCHAKNGF